MYIRMQAREAMDNGDVKTIASLLKNHGHLYKLHLHTCAVCGKKEVGISVEDMEFKPNGWYETRPIVRLHEDDVDENNLSVFGHVFGEKKDTGVLVCSKECDDKRKFDAKTEDVLRA